MKLLPDSTAVLYAVTLTWALLPLCNCTMSKSAVLAPNMPVKSMFDSRSASFWSRFGMVTSALAPVTNVKRMPSCSVIIWLLVPNVVGPPAWLVLIVSPVVMLMSSAVLSGLRRTDWPGPCPSR